MVNAFPIALSGAQAAQTRLSVSASNVANLRSTGVLPDARGPNALGPNAVGPNAQGPVPDGAPRAYEALRTSQTAIAGPGGQGLGTLATARPANPAIVAEAAPDSPFANGDGLIAAPNVDLVGERVEQIAAGAAYKAALAVIRTQSEMERELLNVRA
ncbi:MAG: flagellar basal-body rod protein FlgC [Pseudomonadota bacterium]|jgi:flagellar basal-body rod protein FlgC